MTNNFSITQGEFNRILKHYNAFKSNTELKPSLKDDLQKLLQYCLSVSQDIKKQFSSGSKQAKIKSNENATLKSLNNEQRRLVFMILNRGEDFLHNADDAYEYVGVEKVSL